MGKGTSIRRHKLSKCSRSLRQATLFATTDARGFRKGQWHSPNGRRSSLRFISHERTQASQTDGKNRNQRTKIRKEPRNARR